VSEYCGAPRRSDDLARGIQSKGKPCRNPAGMGTDHPGIGACKFHGGRQPSHTVHAERVRAAERLQKKAARYGVGIDVTPDQALLSLVREAAGNVAWLSARMEELLEDAPFAAGDTNIGTGQQRAYDPGYKQGRGLFGPLIAVDKDGLEHIVGEEYRAMVKLYKDEREMLRKVSKDAVEAGLIHAQVEAAQQQAQMLVVVLNRVFTRMGLPEEQILLARQLTASEFRSLSPEPMKRVGVER
jgi:hypothetical protein